MRSILSIRNTVVGAFVAISVALAAVPAQAISITFDPGPAGSSIAAGTSFNLPDLLGPAADGPVIVDIFFSDGKYLDFSSLGIFNIILDLDFSNASGSFGSSIGAMLGLDGDPIPGAILGTITNSTLRTINQFGAGFGPLAYGIRYNFSFTGADPGTAITAASLLFHNGPTPIGQSVSVPEPATLGLFGGGLLLGFAGLRRSRRRLAA